MLLEVGQLDQVSVRLLAEVEAVCVDDQLEPAVREPEVEQTDAGDVGRVRKRLEGRDRGRTAFRIGSELVDDPGDLVAARTAVVEETHGIALGVSELRYVLLDEEVL